VQRRGSPGKPLTAPSGSTWERSPGSCIRGVSATRRASRHKPWPASGKPSVKRLKRAWQRMGGRAQSRRWTKSTRSSLAGAAWGTWGGRGGEHDVQPMARTLMGRRWVEAVWPPLLSWQQHAARTCGPRRRAQMLQALQAMQAACETPPSTRQLALDGLVDGQAWVAECAKTLQRAASAVEGRHGELAQMHHYAGAPLPVKSRRCLRAESRHRHVRLWLSVDGMPMKPCDRALTQHTPAICSSG